MAANSKHIENKRYNYIPNEDISKAAESFEERDMTRSRKLDPTVYGELFVLGCNGTAPVHLQRHMKSKFTLRQRYHPNVSYNFAGFRSIVVEYTRDKSTDMFQIGRYESPPVDIKVTDLNQARKGVSRFACRIVIERNDNHQAKVYAAAFDGTGNVFFR
ncbi:e3 ubiquitin-protein ligase pellino homolog 2 [Caerostris extrusa]|uniref:E3 ubiquitin-protein ligase pellino homolog 2 n=1 Tax=Caerostris extrusa TaxID=172846 RepID=A0AAV4PSD2_CAEEX|nr:e3 ubiquitin-protein ligase pellino homolog 2 [Caerostris extrusa]